MDTGKGSEDKVKERLERSKKMREERGEANRRKAKSLGEGERESTMHVNSFILTRARSLVARSPTCRRLWKRS